MILILNNDNPSELQIKGTFQLARLYRKPAHIWVMPQN